MHYSFQHSLYQIPIHPLWGIYSQTESWPERSPSRLQDILGGRKTFSSAASRGLSNQDRGRPKSPLYMGHQHQIKAVSLLAWIQLHTSLECQKISCVVCFFAVVAEKLNLVDARMEWVNLSQLQGSLDLATTYNKGKLHHLKVVPSQARSSIIHHAQMWLCWLISIPREIGKDTSRSV